MVHPQAPPHPLAPAGTSTLRRFKGVAMTSCSSHELPPSSHSLSSLSLSTCSSCSTQSSIPDPSSPPSTAEESSPPSTTSSVPESPSPPSNPDTTCACARASADVGSSSARRTGRAGTSCTEALIVASPRRRCLSRCRSTSPMPELECEIPVSRERRAAPRSPKRNKYLEPRPRYFPPRSEAAVLSLLPPKGDQRSLRCLRCLRCLRWLDAHGVRPRIPWW